MKHILKQTLAFIFFLSNSILEAFPTAVLDSEKGYAEAILFNYISISLLLIPFWP